MGLSPTARCDCVVRARTGDGRSSQVALVLSARSPDDGDLRLAPLVLGEAFALTIEVSAETGPVTGARVRVGGGPPDHRKSWGWYEAALTDAAGRARLTGLPRGTAGVYVTAEGWGQGVAASPIPRPQGTPLGVRLPPRRHVEVLVLEEGTGNPVPDAEVSLVVTLPQPDRGWVQLGPAEGIAPTDTRGLTRVPAFAPACRGWAYVRAPGRPQRTRASNAPMAWEASQTVVRVPAPNTLSWVVVPGDGPIPADGTPVRVCRGDRIVYGDGYLPPEVGSIENGHLVIPHAMAQTEHRPYHLIATAPDGRSALAAVAAGPEPWRGGRLPGPPDPDRARRPTRGESGRRGRPLAARACRSSCLHERIRHRPPGRVRAHAAPARRRYVSACTASRAGSIGRSRTSTSRRATNRWCSASRRRSGSSSTCSSTAKRGCLRRGACGSADTGGRADRSTRTPDGDDPHDARRTDPLVGSIVRLDDRRVRHSHRHGGAGRDDRGVASSRSRCAPEGRIRARVTPPADGRFALFLERYVDAIGDFGITALPVAPEAARDGDLRVRGARGGALPAAGASHAPPLGRRRRHRGGRRRGAALRPERHGHRCADESRRRRTAGWQRPGWRYGVWSSTAAPRCPGCSRVAGGRPPNTIPVDGQGGFAAAGARGPRDHARRMAPVPPSGGPVEVRGTPRRRAARPAPRADGGPRARPRADAGERSRLESSILLFGDDPRGEPAWRVRRSCRVARSWFGRFEPGVYTAVAGRRHAGAHRLRTSGWERAERASRAPSMRPGCRLRFDLDVRRRPDRVRACCCAPSPSTDRPTRAAATSWSATEVAELTALGAGRFRVAVETLDDPAAGPGSCSRTRSRSTG